MAGRKIATEAEARACLDEVARVDGDRAAWARARGLDGRSLNAWRINLARRDRRRADPPVLRVVELVPAEVAVHAAPTYRVGCGVFAVEVPADFDDDVVARLLRVVARC